MYTELIKIIEGGLKKDVSKVASYSKLLADNLRQNGEGKLADRIISVLGNQTMNPVFMDQIMAAPIDQESRLNMADIILPDAPQPKVVFEESMGKTINEFLSVIKNKDLLQKAGVDVNASLLLYGAPGCGKTTIAKFIAKELKLPLIIARFDTLVSSLLGNTAKNIRRIFDYAASRPCILLLDEFDAIGKARDDQHELGELKRVINSLLQNIDEYTQGHILIAATNHHELLDRAIWRRFNFIVEVGKPQQNTIIQLISTYINTFKTNFLGDEKRERSITSAMADLSFSDIKTICMKAVSKALIEGIEQITLEDIMIEIFFFKTGYSQDQQALATFLLNNGSNRNAIAKFLNIPYYQIAAWVKSESTN